MAAVTPRLLTPDQAAVYLGMPSKGALLKLAQRRGIPHVRQGPRTIRFDVRQLDEWIAEHTIEAAS